MIKHDAYAHRDERLRRLREVDACIVVILSTGSDMPLHRLDDLALEKEPALHSCVVCIARTVKRCCPQPPLTLVTPSRAQSHARTESEFGHRRCNAHFGGARASSHIPRPTSHASSHACAYHAPACTLVRVRRPSLEPYLPTISLRDVGETSERVTVALKLTSCAFPVAP